MQPRATLATMVKYLPLTERKNVVDSEDFFEKLKPWSKRKHRLLGKYLQPFSAKVAKATQNREIYCVDGFAGSARYDDGSEGSPLLIAKFSDECAEWRNPVFLKLINIEPDVKRKGIFTMLDQTTKAWQEKGVVTNILNSFDSALPEILTTIGNAPALFFIDPFGPTYLHFDHLKPILRRPQRITELIINFDQDGLRRILDAAFSERTDPKAAQTNAQNITKILGNENWKGKIGNVSLSSEDVELILLKEYMANIAAFDYNVVGYPIREALDTKPKYHFVYCTRHSDGIELMNDFIREEEDLLYGEHVKDKLSLFPADSLADEEVQKRQKGLREVMKQFFQNNRIITRNQVVKSLVEDHFGYFHGRDYRKIFKEFIENGTLTTSDNATKIDDRTYLVSQNV